MPVSGICVLAVSFASAIVAALSGATAESRAPALAVHAEGAALARHPSQDSAPATRSTILGPAKVLSASDARALGVGDSLFVQAWYRDQNLGIPTSNFTDGVAATLR